MKEYSITSPSVSAIISDDYLYFEGIKKPSLLFSLRDHGESVGDPSIMDRYWNDLYNLFLRKLTQFACSQGVNNEESIKLQALLQELVKVKDLIENAPKTAIMRQ